MQMNITAMDAFVLVWYVLWILSVLGYGSALYTFLSGVGNGGTQRDSEIETGTRTTVVGMLGFMAISAVGLIVNFFMPVDTVVSITLLSVGLVLFFLYIKKADLISTPFQWVIVLLLAFYTGLYIFVKVWLYDTGLYHLQTVKWITSAPVPFGLANLHHRFGYNSAWYIIGAVMEPPRQIVHAPYFIINPLITFFYGTGVFFSIRKVLQKQFSFSDGFMILSFIPWLWHLGFQTASLSNNTPVFLLVALMVYLVIYELEGKREPGSATVCLLIFLFSLFAVTLKLSVAGFAAGSVLFAVIQGVRKKGITLKSKPFVIILFAVPVIIIPWLIRGVFLSGAPLYPSKIGFIPGLKWSVPTVMIEEDAAVIKRFARVGNNPTAVSSNWKWVKPWFRRNYQNLKSIAVPGIVGVILLVISGSAGIGRGPWRLLIVPLAVSTGGVVFWFLTAPAVRFGYGYLHAASLLVFGFSLYRLLEWLTRFVGRFTAVDSESSALFIFGIATLFRARTDIFLFLATGAAIIIFIQRGKKYLGITVVFALFITLFFNPYLSGYFGENLFMEGRVPSVQTIERRTTDGAVINKPVGTDQCWDSPLICTPYFDSEMKIDFSPDGTPRMFRFPKK
jgi:hypothetical protein